MMDAPERISPLDPRWAERKADQCEYLLSNTNGIAGHCHTLDELVEDYIRIEKPYLNVEAYRKIDFNTFASEPRTGYWIIVVGPYFRAVTADDPETIIKWFPMVRSTANEGVRLYERIDISAQVQAVHAERRRKADEARQRELQREATRDAERVMTSIRCGYESVEEIAAHTYFTVLKVERIVNEQIAQGKLELVDWQPPVQKLIKVKQS